ncbi:MAG: hypothetical protein H0U96_02260 [Acidobacteria bacterium]|nr:hypothetical protein [Acidobacteriota bacterium]
MKKILRLFLFFALAVNFYASPLIFKLPKEIERSEISESELYTHLRNINPYNATGQIFEKLFKQSKTFDFKPEIYIPAAKRHQGLSRFDLLPFTDRQKGDPDRYRAVNPKYVKRETGHYYFALNVKADTHYYDETLKDKGVLSDTNVKVDLTRTITAKTKNTKTEKHVYVKDKGYVSVSALTQTASEIRAGRWFYFPIKSGEHWLYDGMGIARGKLAADSVKLNYGQKKEIKGENYYYAFSTKIIVNRRREAIGASGWIKASTLQDGNDPQYDAEFVKKMQMPTAADDIFTDYEITGGNPQETIGTDENGKIKYKFGYANEKGAFVAYKVLPRIPLDGNQSIASTDYLKRADNVINLGFNVAGVSNDTFTVSGANRPLIFHRSADKDASAVIDLFYPKDANRDGEKIAGKMIFVYGYVDTAARKRWGWIPLDALKLKS